jgi:hypothetical protein
VASSRIDHDRRPERRIFAHAVTIGGHAPRLPTLTITSWDRLGQGRLPWLCSSSFARSNPGLLVSGPACSGISQPAVTPNVNILSHAPIVSEWHVAAVSGEHVVDVDLFGTSVFRYLLMVSTSLSTSFVAVRTPLEDMFLAFRRLACDMPRSVNSGATIELSVCLSTLCSARGRAPFHWRSRSTLCALRTNYLIGSA